ncbi:DUF6305 family protein [Tepidibacter formicigenes]|uniref:DUF6305 domain-containing protein n=1 Tax=Tepidibacter formicigenes DSM 15518 TaxID=1123349 RepID=A0A1M6M3S1_9FIRM|nr:DUF6305 family protein [Tepidibacter formicigenes]SHJ78114.1 hypothetical protein SAMN02744037_00817 [Tepidibacter formicigenes DSM 15518]
MKTNILRFIVFISILLVVASFFNSCKIQLRDDRNVLPSLPRPIAKGKVLITSAGQSTDTYIVKDIANKLMIHNFFMPQAREVDLEGINTVVFVVGYSPIGENLHDLGYNQEVKRIKNLIKILRKKKITIITVFIGNRKEANKKTDKLLNLTCKYANYVISTKNNNNNQYLLNLAKLYNFKLTLVEDVTGLSEPFASAFR